MYDLELLIQEFKILMYAMTLISLIIFLFPLDWNKVSV